MSHSANGLDVHTDPSPEARLAVFVNFLSFSLDLLPVIAR